MTAKLHLSGFSKVSSRARAACSSPGLASCTTSSDANQVKAMRAYVPRIAPAPYPAVYLIVPLRLAAVSAAARFLPALRAARVDPLVALRSA